MPFRPGLVPTLATLVGAAITLNLSAWQYGRHQDQVERLDEIRAHIDAPPVTGEALGRPPDDLAWRKAVLRGTFDAERRAYVSGRFLFGRAGYQIIEPLVTGDGPPILVDRGWIPAQDWSSHLDEIATRGPVEVRGLLLPIEPGGRVSPIPADDTHPQRLPQETTSFLGVGTRRVGTPWATLAARHDDVAPVYLVAGDERSRGRPPRPEPLPVDGYIAWPKVIGHLSYAGQWALITVVMICVWGWAGVLRGRRIAAGD